MVVWEVGGLGRERGACGWGEAKRVRTAFPIAPVRPRRDAQDGVLKGVSGMTVAGVADVASKGEEARDLDNP